MTEVCNTEEVFDIISPAAPWSLALAGMRGPAFMPAGDGADVFAAREANADPLREIRASPCGGFERAPIRAKDDNLPAPGHVAPISAHHCQQASACVPCLDAASDSTFFASSARLPPSAC